MAISKRLKYVADLVSPGSVVADIGTDHGYVPVYLLREGRCPKAIAVDVSPGALQKAKDNALRFHLEDRMDCRLADGLAALDPGEADSIVICGMGGILMQRILTDHPEISTSAKELILSPHRNPELILDFLRESGFEVVHDEIIEDKKKQYRIFKGKKPEFA